MAGANLHIYPSTFTAETRMLKITKSLANHGIFDRIYVAARWEPGLPLSERIDERREVVRLRTPLNPVGGGLLTKLFSYLLWMWIVIRRFRRAQLTCVNCHSLSVLPIGVWFKLTRRTMLVYDTHELETETLGSIGLRRVVARLFERLMIRMADAVVVVSPSTGTWYRQTYGLNNVAVVRNVPYRSARTSQRSHRLRSTLGIAPDAILFILSGALGEGRGIELVLEVFSRVDPGRHLVFLGSGPLEDLIRQHMANHSNIHFHPAVAPAEVSAMTSGADVGFSFYDDSCLNHYYSLGNKIFEYAFAGVPVVVSRLPDRSDAPAPAQCQIVDEQGFGWKVPLEVDAVVQAVNAIDRSAIEEKRGAALRYREMVSWEDEEPELIGVYETLGLYKLPG